MDYWELLMPQWKKEKSHNSMFFFKSFFGFAEKKALNFHALRPILGKRIENQLRSD